MNRKLGQAAGVLAALWVLAGCAPLLERTYAVAEPHSSKFWESEAAGTLRAENRQDVVNDLLLLIGQHTETATLRLYNYESDLTVADTLEGAAMEIQQETPMGAYAVEYITASSHAQRGYYEVAVRLSYRRTLEQLQAVVNATSPEAVYSLLAGALDEGKTELAVRIGYWGENGRTRVEEAMAQLREERGLEETTPWVVNCYPTEENPGLVEFLLDPPEPPEPVEGEMEGEIGGDEGGEVKEDATGIEKEEEPPLEAGEHAPPEAEANPGAEEAEGGGELEAGEKLEEKFEEGP